MDKRYQVFVSSTYSDLQEERGKVMQTIMSLDCIPAGMELFPAIDTEQFEFIKKVIDDCDYYLLIVGGRYGSMSDDGISYTEKEYDYALEKNIPVIAFLHEDISKLTFEKCDADTEKREKLIAFRDKVAKGRLVQFWNNADDLNGKVAVSLMKTIKVYPAVGWVRANMQSNTESLQEINNLRKKIELLEEENLALKKDVDNQLAYEDIAGLEESIIIRGRNGGKDWNLNITWERLFALISPYFLEYHNEDKAKSIIMNVLLEEAGLRPSVPSLNNQDFQTIKVQFTTLGLIALERNKTVIGASILFWHLTDKGMEYMRRLRIVKTVKS